MIARLAEAGDLPSILRLQDMNLYDNLSPAERQGGFVTTPFTLPQLEALIAGRGLFVVEGDGQVGGYTAAADWQYFSQWPINPYMINRLAGREFRGMRISLANSFQYGPVCIASGLRGTGAFPLLFEGMRRELAPRFPIGVTFINQANERSYRAHTGRLGMEVVDGFTFGTREYHTLVFATAVSVLR